MNQQCKVCGEPAAGFHFGAFTCEGCKSFFGRSYNNLGSISECKNGGECVINKKNRTACKACRLRKCLLVGMSKSGSRYGRRSNWFKIHCLLQEQQQQQHQQLQQQQQQQQHQHQQQQHQQHQQQHQHQQFQQALSSQQHQHQLSQQQRKPMSPPIGLHGGQRKDDVLLLGVDEYKNSTSPSISSPESHNSDSSVEISERRAAFAGHPGFRPLHSQLPASVADLSVLGKEMMGLPLGFHLGGMSLIPPAFLPPPTLGMFSPYHLYAPAHGAAHPLVSSHSSALLRHSPMIENNEAGGAAGTATPTAPVAALEEKDSCANNNNDRYMHNNNVQTRRRSLSPCADQAENYSKRYYLDAVLKSQRTPRSGSPGSVRARTEADSPSVSLELDVDSSPPQDDPIDLSMKSCDGGPRLGDDRTEEMEIGHESEENENENENENDNENENENDSEDERDSSPPKRRPAPIDLTVKA